MLYLRPWFQRPCVRFNICLAQISILIVMELKQSIDPEIIFAFHDKYEIHSPKDS
jgi:hypothetical protein